MDSLTDIYPELTMYDISVVEFLFDRLSFTDKCGLIYSHIQNMTLNELPIHFYAKNNFLLERMIPIILEKNKQNPSSDIFGFYLTYHNKPLFEVYTKHYNPM